MEHFDHKSDSTPENNPFLDGISPFIPFRDLPKKLSYSPLTTINWKSVPPGHRESLLDYADRHFVPTANILEPTAGIQSLLRRTLNSANPLKAENKIRCNQIAVAFSNDSLRHISSTQGGGMLLSGMTGSGKTALIKRSLEILVSQQVVDHGNSAAGGYYGLRRCVYLVVDHPSNGSRGALLKRILHCLDEKLQTSYFDDHKKTVNIDSLLVVVCKLLTRHRVSLLCIDEKQESTFEDSPWRTEFSLFYLQLMNLGISVVLSGNPLAFEHMSIYSQLVRRFSTGGIHSLAHARPSIDEWWPLQFVPQARKFSLVENWNISDEARKKFEDDNSGGLPGVFMAFHVEVQRSALSRGDFPAEVSEHDFLIAQNSPRFKHLRRIGLALSSEDSRTASQFIDIPPIVTPEPDSKAKITTNLSKTPPYVSHKKTTAVTERMVRNFKYQQTKKINQLTKNLKVFSQLPPDDLRRLGVSEELINEMDMLLSMQSSQSNKKPDL